MRTLFVSVSLFTLALVAWQCQHPEPEPMPLSCGGGYEPIDGQCKCPPDKKEAYGVCRALGKLGYYAVASSCYCPDTMLLNLTNKQYDPFTQTATIDVQLVDGGNIAHGETRTASVAYFARIEGDSIEGELWYGYCKIGDQPCLPYLYGKMIGTDTLRLKIVYRSRRILEDMVVPVDSCVVYLHK